MNLKALGWNDKFEKAFRPFLVQGYNVGRVSQEHKNLYRVITEEGEKLAQVSGKMKYLAQGRVDYPAVGDWVVVSTDVSNSKAIIHAVLPRQSKFSRKVAGVTTEEQIVATNINTVFIVMALNKDFNVRRIERYLTLAWESGANPVVILSKADLCDEVQQKLEEVKEIAFGVPIHVISSLNGQGLEELIPYLSVGNTVALLGSSGTGKSTLINKIVGGSVQKVKEIRQDDDKGRHTTTSRELIVLSQGGVLIDTPGMREVQLWGSEEGLSNSFDDIEEVAKTCRFSDCRHQSEPGCAVKAALAEGTINESRYQSYLKLQKELAYLANQQEYLEQKKKLQKSYRNVKHRR